MSKKAKELKLVGDYKWLYEIVVAREELVSTAIGKGVAMLHPRHMHPTKIKLPTVIFGRSTEGVEFDAPDDQPVHLFFLLLLHNDKQHLFSLSFITKFLMHEENVKLLTEAQNPKEVYQAIASFDPKLKNGK
jgi:PTS system fructose-specific IIC component